MEGEYISLDTAKKLAKAKALLPEGVEAVVISKDDYDRLSGELTKENIELKLEIERLNNIIKELEKYINETKLEEFEKEYGRRYGKTFTQAEVIICNMILNKLQELKGSDKE